MDDIPAEFVQFCTLQVHHIYSYDTGEMSEDLKESAIVTTPKKAGADR